MNARLLKSLVLAEVFAVISTCTSLAQSSVVFTNPVPPGYGFGWGAAAASPETILIGDYGDNDSAGSVFLFSTNGFLIHQFDNPSPANGLGFGQSVAMVGTNHFIAGAPAGAGPVGSQPGVAALFQLGGALINVFPDPAPAPRRLFGQEVAALGSDRVLIAALDLGNGPGVVYLYKTNGTLLTTFTNPAPFPGPLLDARSAWKDSTKSSSRLKRNPEWGPFIFSTRTAHF